MHASSVLRPLVLTLALSLGASLALPAAALTIHDESVDGDLSDDRFDPTDFVLAAGSSEFIGSVVDGDRDYWTIVIPDGHALAALEVLAYDGSGQAFTAIQAGPVVTVPPDTFSAAGLLGFSLFGSGSVGTDILDDIGAAGLGADGFTPPLPAGTYTIWTQETSTTPSSYTLSYVVTPEPAAGALLLGAGIVAAGLRRRVPRS